MPKDNEVDEKVIARYVWTNAGMKGGEPQWAGNWVRYDDHAATVAELRAEVAEQSARADKWKALHDAVSLAHEVQAKSLARALDRADAAERRVGELTSLLSDTVGNLHRMGNNEFADCDQERLDIVISRIERTLTGADPT